MDLLQAKLVSRAGVLARNNVKCKVINIQHLCEQSICEAVSIRMKDNILLVSNYRVPGSDFNRFLELLENLINKLLSEKNKSLRLMIGCGFNIDLIKHTGNYRNVL